MKTKEEEQQEMKLYTDMFDIIQKHSPFKELKLSSDQISVDTAIRAMLDLAATQTRDQVIDECIFKIKSLIVPGCHDHVGYRGACVNCGEYDAANDALPDPNEVITALELMKGGKDA